MWLEHEVTVPSQKLQLVVLSFVFVCRLNNLDTFVPR